MPMPKRLAPDRPRVSRAATPAPEVLARLRLVDRVRPPLKVLFVGINPGVRSATSGHHFAGFSNRFWKLLYESKLVPRPVQYVDDDHLPDWGYGVTNLVPRPTPGIDTLRPEEYRDGLRTLRRKIRRWRPAIVALVGVTLYRSVFEVRGSQPVRLGRQRELLEGARVFVLPNPSGRNANFSYAEMLAAFVALRASARRLRATPPAAEPPATPSR